MGLEKAESEVLRVCFARFWGCSLGVSWVVGDSWRSFLRSFKVLRSVFSSAALGESLRRRKSFWGVKFGFCLGVNFLPDVKFLLGIKLLVF